MSDKKVVSLDEQRNKLKLAKAKLLAALEAELAKYEKKPEVKDE